MGRGFSAAGRGVDGGFGKGPDLAFDGGRNQIRGRDQVRGEERRRKRHASRYLRSFMRKQI